MPHLFTEPEVKIRRARKHLAELETLIGALRDSYRYEIRVIRLEDGRQGAEMTLHLDQPPSDADSIGAIIGDVVHNLRAALDLTACDIVRAAKGANANVNNVYFPFSGSADQIGIMIQKRNFHRAGERAVELLLRFKPYIGGNIALRAIHDLDVQDKHTSLIPSVLNVASPVLSQWDDDGSPNLSIVGDPTSPSDFLFFFPDNAPLAGKEIIPALHGLVEITQGIVNAFRALANE